MDSVTPTPTPTPTWTKQILPEGSYTHQDYSPELLTRVVELFNPGKGVPFTLSSIKDPTKANAGILRGVEYHPTLGILGHFELTDEAAQHVQKYPRFGVTATVSQGGRITAVVGTNTPQIPGMAGWEKVTLTETEEEPESDRLQYEEVETLDLAQPQQNRGMGMAAGGIDHRVRQQVVGELQGHGISVNGAEDGALLVYLTELCQRGRVYQARSEFRSGTAQHRVRVKTSGAATTAATAATTAAPTQESSRSVNLSEPQSQQNRGNTMSSNNLDPDVRLRLENFVGRTLGVSATGMAQSDVVDLAMQASVGREREYAEAITGQDIIDNRVESQDNIRAWLDNNCG